eukprot:748144-Prymnesium_polylepis.1
MAQKAFDFYGTEFPDGTLHQETQSTPTKSDEERCLPAAGAKPPVPCKRCDYALRAVAGPER